MILFNFQALNIFKLAFIVFIPSIFFGFATVASSTGTQNVQELTAKGMELAESWRGDTQKLKQAEGLFIQALKINSNSAEALTGLAKVEMSKGYISGDKYEESSLKAALQYANRALSSNPQYIKAHLIKGLIFSAMGNHAGASEEANAIRAIDSSSCDQYSLLADSFRRQGKFGEAIEEGLKDLSCPETDKDKIKKGNALYRLAACYDKLKDYPNAALYYKKILDLTPTAWAYGNYSRALMFMGNFDEAEKMALMARAIMDYPMLHRYLSDIYYKKGEIFEKRGDDINAEKQYFLSLKEDSENIWACYQLVGIYVKRGDCDAAFKVAKYGERIYPHDSYMPKIITKCSQLKK